MTQRDVLIKKIQALLRKTTANGCTEDEAVVAAEHAAKLMEQYDLTFKDVEKEIRGQKFAPDERPFSHWSKPDQWSGSGRRIFPAVRGCVRAVAEFFDCEYWYVSTNLVFFGIEDDTALAHSMTTMLQSAIDQETRTFLARTAGDGEHGLTKRRSFEDGITDRLADRLRTLKRTRTEADQQAHETLATVHAGGNFHAPVVVAKKLVVQEKFEELGIKLVNTHRSRSTGSRSGYMAGQAAGERVSLGARRGLLKERH